MLGMIVQAQSNRVFRGQELPANSLRLKNYKQQTSGYRFFKFNSSQVYNYVKNLGKSDETSFSLFFDQKHQWNITITPSNITTANYVVRTQGRVFARKQKSHTYQGFIAQIPGSNVSMSIYKNRLTGFVSLPSGEKTFFETIEQINNVKRNEEVITLYDIEDLEEQKTTCGTTGKHNAAIDKNKRISGVQECVSTPIALAVDLAAYQLENNDMNVLQTRLEEYINTLNGLYSPLDIKYTLSEVYVSTTGNESWNDGTKGPDELLGEFTAWARQPGKFQNTNAVATLWSGHDLPYAYAFVGVVCTRSRFNIVPYSKTGGTTVILHAHELGHNWGAEHASDGSSIMSPTVFSNSTSWDSESNRVITAAKGSASCLNPCSDNNNNALAVSSFTPVSGSIGTEVAITGTGFSTTVADNIVKFNGVTATVSSATATELRVTVLQGTTTGKVTVEVNGQTASSTNDFSITVNNTDPVITNFTPKSGPIGTEVTITGSNFGVGVSANTVTFNGTTATVNSATATQLKVTVLTGTTTGKVTIETGGKSISSTDNFSVTTNNTDITITNFTPKSGPIDTTVTITGSNFGSTNEANIVSFNGVTATVISATSTELKVKVPQGASTGKITVETGSQSVITTENFTITNDNNPVADFNINPKNLITPNGDARNDTWEIEGLEQVSDFHIRVFSKAGQVVFEATDYSKPWDGTFNGKRLAPGVYYYNILMTIRGAKGSKTGFITLIR